MADGKIAAIGIPYEKLPRYYIVLFYRLSNLNPNKVFPFLKASQSSYLRKFGKTAKNS